ncbi:MAG TPA: wax ester/triacylglycerol synthase domain-containing protein [Pseudonocardiaceae bacterium]|nr:wax ester/triacylglycerol synthase domain-containing protein [Pseudonocardiaceae bacterium]
MSDRPTRVLIVSADMGEGHNSAGRALEQAARARWPEVEVRWLDTLDVMGRGVGPAFRGIYVTNVERTPWLYEFFYSSIRRWRWFANSSKAFVGNWAGRRLGREIEKFRPDVIMSTYPLGSAGLAWLRRHGRLDVPAGAWICDFSPHPFWVYPDLDLNLVMHEVAVKPATTWVPGSSVAVSAPPVRDAFAPGDRGAARKKFDLPDDGFVALVSCGVFGFGSVESAAKALLDADPDITVVVACAKNKQLRERLLAGGDHGGRLRPLGWTDDMPALTLASDVVVTNAGGATSLEALACGRPILMYQPIAAHGRANAVLMAEAGLAEVCQDTRSLADAVHRLIHEPDHLAALERAALAHTAARTLDDSLTALFKAAEQNEVAKPERLRPEDALFVHVQTAEVPQQLGAVLVLDPKEDGSPPTFADAVDLFDASPGLKGRIIRGNALRHPAFQPDPTVDPAALLDVVDVRDPDTPADLDGAMDAFFSVPLDERRETGRAQLVLGLDGGRSAFLVKLHHAASDGIAVTGALVGRTRGQTFIADPKPAKPQDRPTVKQRLNGVKDLVTGLAALAGAGRAPRLSLDGPVASAARHHALVDLPLDEIRVAARALKVRTTDLATALLVESLHQVLPDATTRDTVRVMMPRSTRSTATYRSAGNHTGAASVDLPIGPMSLERRIELTKQVTQDQVDSSAPHAAHAVVWTLGQLPPFLHRRLAKLVYRSTWFNLIASVLPGARSPVILHGSRVAIVYPVLALAPGVRLSVGVMTWANHLTYCFTGDSATSSTVDALADATRAAFKQL